MTKQQKVAASLIILVLIAVVIGRITSPPNSNLGDQKLRVGAILTLTGPGAFFGEEVRNGMELANQDQEVHLSIEDSATNPTQGVSAFTKLVDTNHADLIVVALSVIGSAVRPEAIRRHVPLIHTLISQNDVQIENLYSLRYYNTGTQDAGIGAQIALKKLHAKTAALLHISDEYGLSHRDGFKAPFEEGGGRIVVEEKFRGTDADFRTQLAKIKAANPDVVYLIALDKSMAAILKQARELGIKSQFITNWVLANPGVQQTVGANDEGVYLTSPSFYLEKPDAYAQSFIGSYTKKYGKAPSAYSAIGYDIVHLLGKIERSENETPEGVIQKITDLETLEGAMGNLTISDQGEISFPLYPARIEGGKLVSVSP